MKSQAKTLFQRKHPALFHVPQTASKIVCFVSWQKNATPRYGAPQKLQNHLEPVLPQSHGQIDDSLERF